MKSAISTKISSWLRALWSQDGRPRLKTALVRICLVCAAAALLYGLMCGIFCGFGISGLFIWPLIALLLLVLALWLGDMPPFRRLRRHRALRCAVAVLCVAALLYCATVTGLVISGAVTDAPPDVDYIIVLGAKVNGERPSLALRCRIDAAYDYLAANPRTVAVLSGGQGSGEDISEAEAMRRALTARGIAPERLLAEDMSTSTEENIRFSYSLLPSEACRVGIVTNNFHVWRALRVAEKQGSHTLCGISADYPNLLIVNYVAREVVTITYYMLAGRI